jgi:hypothetical protein
MGYTWQGLFIKRQNEVAADYAALISNNYSPLQYDGRAFSGTHSDKVIELVSRHVTRN